MFRSGVSKSRAAFLGLLQAGRSGHVVNDVAVARMHEMDMAAGQIDALASHGDKRFACAEAWASHLAALGFDKLNVQPDPVKVGSLPKVPYGVPSASKDC